MTKVIYFVDDPGPAKMKMLDAMRNIGVEPRRIDGWQAIPRISTTNDQPLAVVIGPTVEDRSSYVTSIRERKDLAGVPILATIVEQSDELLEEAIKDGVDDILVDGAQQHFAAFLAGLGNTDSWQGVRAPQGLAMLAETDRTKRIRLAAVLRKNGYDVTYSSDPKELALSVYLDNPRVVVASMDMARKTMECVWQGNISLRTTGIPGVPWMVIADDSMGPAIRPVPNVISKCSFVKSSDDYEQLTFVLNELLAPPQKESRRTKRVLYGTPIHFSPENSDLQLKGYSYNVNDGGMFIRTLLPLPKGTPVKMRFRTPISGQEVEVVGQVAWAREFSDQNGTQSPPGMGIQFTHWKEDHQAIYEASYEALLKNQTHEQDSLQGRIQDPRQPNKTVEKPVRKPAIDTMLEPMGKGIPKMRHISLSIQ